jgi:hypothetical protein
VTDIPKLKVGHGDFLPFAVQLLLDDHCGLKEHPLSMIDDNEFAEALTQFDDDCGADLRLAGVGDPNTGFDLRLAAVCDSNSEG